MASVPSYLKITVYNFPVCLWLLLMLLHTGKLIRKFRGKKNIHLKVVPPPTQNLHFGGEMIQIIQLLIRCLYWSLYQEKSTLALHCLLWMQLRSEPVLDALLVWHGCHCCGLTLSLLLLVFFSLNIYLLYFICIYECSYVCMCPMCATGACRGQETVSDPLGFELDRGLWTIRRVLEADRTSVLFRNSTRS